MTAARDELHRLVDALPEEQVTRAIAAVTVLASDVASIPAWPPLWIGAITTERADVSERVDELLAEGFGR